MCTEVRDREKGRYEAVDPRKSPRFSGIRTFMRLPYVRKLEDVDFAIVGAPFDTGASTGEMYKPEINPDEALEKYVLPPTI